MKGMFHWERLTQKAAELFQKYKYVLLVIAAGIVLLLLPVGGEDSPVSAGTESQNESGGEVFQVEEMERKLEQALSRVDGAGEVTVVLTVKSSARQVLAQDSARSGEESTTSTVVVSTGSGTKQRAAGYGAGLRPVQGGEYHQHGGSVHRIGYGGYCGASAGLPTVSGRAGGLPGGRQPGCLPQTGGRGVSPYRAGGR